MHIFNAGNEFLSGKYRYNESKRVTKFLLKIYSSTRLIMIMIP